MVEIDIFQFDMCIGCFPRTNHVYTSATEYKKYREHNNNRIYKYFYKCSVSMLLCKFTGSICLKISIENYFQSVNGSNRSVYEFWAKFTDPSRIWRSIGLKAILSLKITSWAHAHGPLFHQLQTTCLSTWPGGTWAGNLQANLTLQLAGNLQLTNLGRQLAN